MTDEQVAEALRMRSEENLSYREIARRLDVKFSTLAARCYKASGCVKYVAKSARIDDPIVPATEHNARDFFAELRSARPHTNITAVFCGDPLPGRSALEARMQNGGSE